MMPAHVVLIRTSPGTPTRRSDRRSPPRTGSTRPGSRRSQLLRPLRDQRQDCEDQDHQQHEQHVMHQELQQTGVNGTPDRPGESPARQLKSRTFQQVAVGPWDRSHEFITPSLTTSKRPGRRRATQVTIGETLTASSRPTPRHRDTAATDTWPERMGTSETSESASKCFHCPNRMNSRNNLRPPSPHVSRVVAVDADDRSLECKGFDM